jgi:hypothetical protein
VPTSDGVPGDAFNTNRLVFRQSNGPKKGTGALIIHWDGIETLYRGRFPAVLYRAERKDLNKVVVKVARGHDPTTVQDAKVLMEIDCSEWRAARN